MFSDKYSKQDWYVSEYSANFTPKALNGEKGKGRPYSEDFAECVVEYFKNYDNFAWKFPEKANILVIYSINIIN